MAFRSKSLGGGASATSVTPTEPAGATTNDILVYKIVVAGTNTSFNGPSGWNLQYNLPGTAADFWVYWIRRTGSAPAYQSTWTGSAYVEASVTCWSGRETTGNPWFNASAIANNARTSRNPCAANCPSVATGVNDVDVIACGMGWAGWATGTGGWTAPTNYTIRENCGAFTEGDICVASRNIAVAATEDPGAFGNAKGTSDEVAEVTIGLMPPQGAAAAVRRLLLLGVS